MRREGRQRGWVRVYDRALVDPEGKRRAVHVVDGPVVANGGFIRAPRKPTNQSKSGGLRALGRDALVQEDEEERQLHPPLGAGHSGYYCTTTCQSPFRFEAVPYGWRYDAFAPEEVQAPRPPPAARSGGRGASCKGSRKFKHSEIKMYYVDAADDVDGRLDYLCDFDS
ncbi:hypothetical protein CFC21_046063 [Triticum aestivum]|nr:uncharacterized protein LOC109769231 [Aegilops tauschii subsp. strangulata]XP_044352949.1 uncharacterized protein LOC123074069 [Triticum aestivum]KAF7035149.1 hypothetical protein CFC21_046063 [Triticum aestivum]